jgi:hypothetical protein
MTAIEFKFSLNPHRCSSPSRLNFADKVPGLSLEASANLNLTIDPKFQISAGLRLAPGLALQNRFYIAENADPEAQLTVTAGIDDPLVNGTLGFLNVKLEEDPAVPDNQGVSITGNVTVNLADPGTSSGADGRITFAEIASSLPAVFKPALSADFKIDGLLLSANVGESTLGALRVSLDEQVTSPEELAQLLQKVQIQGELASFLNFNNITPQMILDALQVLEGQLRTMGAGGVFDQPLPLINKSLSELVDLGQSFVEKLGLEQGVPSLGTAQALEDFLNSRFPSGLAVKVVVNPGDIRFTFKYADSFSKQVPFAFDLNDTLAGLVHLDGNGQLALHLKPEAQLTLGFTTAGGNVPFLERVFLAAGGDTGSWFDITATANAGYDTNDDGVLTPETEGQPIDLNASLGPLAVSVVDARALLDLRAGANVIDQDITARRWPADVPGDRQQCHGRHLDSDARGRYRDPSASRPGSTAPRRHHPDRRQRAGRHRSARRQCLRTPRPEIPSKDARIEIAGRLMNLFKPTASSSRSCSTLIRSIIPVPNSRPATRTAPAPTSPTPCAATNSTTRASSSTPTMSAACSAP